MSIKKADNKPFNFKSIYVYVVGGRQKINFTAFRACSEVPGLSQTFDLLMALIPDVTFNPSNWNDLDELRITNNGPPFENGTGYIIDLALDLNNFTYELAPLVTAAATLVNSLSVTFNGSITDVGSGTITEKGVVYATTTSPTINDLKRAVPGGKYR